MEQRALPPDTENKKLVEIEVLKDIPCSSGEIAPWFDQPGGGIQYFTNVKIETPTGELVEATLENLEYYGYIRILN